VVSFLYSSVGHGGASGYLALMVLFDFPTEKMKITALLLNLFVAAVSFLNFYKKGYFNKNIFWVFAISSVPFALIGGYIDFDVLYYRKILGVLLIFAILKILNIIKPNSNKIQKVKNWLGLSFGSIIGFFSGLIGIGGGVILTPLILLMKWGGIKEAAAVSALFIWVNSASAMTGQIISGKTLSNYSIVLVLLALVGGFLGSYFGSRKLNSSVLKVILSTVLLIASLKLLLS
jgi:uncharacterized membrane protein YfcA